MPLPADIVDAVLARFRIDAPIRADLIGLQRVYAGWCDSISFDNVHKLVHLAEGGGSPLPGSTAAGFFTGWLAHGTGGTCWAGNGALHDLLAALGFRVERAAATMMANPDTPPSNHGSVVVHLAGDRYLTDASILSGAPLRMPRPGEQLRTSKALPRIERLGDTCCIVWRTLRSPEGFPCRIDRVGVTAEEWDALHQRTREWSPFNFAVSARVNRGPRVIGFGIGQRYQFAGDALTAEPRDRAGRDRFLVDELGMDPALVARLPDDREIPPAPPTFLGR